jgi:hypothetical protein
MTRFTAIAILAASLALTPQLASAQTLADVAKAEEARRKGVKKPAKTYTNDNLRPDITTPAVSAVPANGTPGAPDAAPKPGVPSVNIPLSPDPAATTPAAAPSGDQAAWAARMSAARTALERTRMFADALQSRLNALATDIVNRDDPAQRSVLELERTKALAELERVKKEMAEQTQAIATIEDDARKAGIPMGWIR